MARSCSFTVTLKIDATGAARSGELQDPVATYIPAAFTQSMLCGHMIHLTDTMTSTDLTS